MKVFNGLFFLILLSSAFLTSCGSGGAGASGSAVILTTSNVYANANTSSIDSDVIRDTATSAGIHKDSVSVVIVSTLTAKAGITALPVQINSVIVSYTAKNGGPILTSITYPLGNTIPAGSSKTFDIDVVSLEQKESQLFVCAGSPCYYDVKLTFDVAEVGLNASSGTPVTNTTINCTNFVDK